MVRRMRTFVVLCLLALPAGTRNARAGGGSFVTPPVLLRARMAPPGIAPPVGLFRLP